MKKRFYQLTTNISKLLGTWVFVGCARIIASGYFLFRPRLVRNSHYFYRALYPGKSFWFHLWCAFRQFQGFTRVFLDRFIQLEIGKITHTSVGWDGLENAVNSKEGGIILMSHMGNWEIAAHRFKETNKNFNLLLYLGQKHKEQIEKLQKDSLKEKGTKIVAVDQNGGSPFLLLESIKWMNEGGFVSLTGDIVWTKEQRVVSVDFLNQTAEIPETPHMLSLVSGKPLFVLFTIPVKKNHYHIEVSKPIYVKAKNRKDKKQAVQRSAQTYANMLETTVKKHPFEWFHFEPFIKKKSKHESK
ncbi:lysophospholipid acyltransferase family protein [bacterium]|nr:lysophospholipid acyltransferase family protein [bacterium]